MPELGGPQPPGASQAWRAERHVALCGTALQALLATRPGEFCGLGRRSCPSRLARLHSALHRRETAFWFLHLSVDGLTGSGSKQARCNQRGDHHHGNPERNHYDGALINALSDEEGRHGRAAIARRDTERDNAPLTPGHAEAERI